MIDEWRAYHIMPGRMPDIQKRFADHTMRLFAKHGITVDVLVNNAGHSSR